MKCYIPVTPDCHEGERGRGGVGGGGGALSLTTSLRAGWQVQRGPQDLSVYPRLSVFDRTNWSVPVAARGPSSSAGQVQSGRLVKVRNFLVNLASTNMIMVMMAWSLLPGHG